MNKIQLLSVAIIGLAAGAYTYIQKSQLNPETVACYKATGERAIEPCLQAYHSAALPDVEHGLVTYRLARLHHDEATYADAIRFYTESIDLGVRRHDAYYYRAILLNAYLDDQAGALANLSMIISENPEDKWALVRRAEINRKLGNLEEAETDIAAATLVDPDFDNLIYERVKLAYEYDDYESILPVLDRAVDLYPDQSGFWEHRSFVKLELDDNSGAFADIEKAIALEPGDHWSWYHRSRVNRRLGDRAAALTDLQTSLSLDPTYKRAAESYRDLIEDVSRSIQRAPDEVIAVATAGLENASDDPELLRLRAAALAKTSQLQPAIADITRAIELAPYPQRYIFTRAVIYDEAMQFQRALADLEQLILDPADNAAAISAVADHAAALLEEGRGREAERFDGQVGDLVIMHARAMKRRVELLQRMDNWPGALEAIDELAADDPDDSRIWIDRAMILIKLERFTEAAESYDKAIALNESGARDLGNNTATHAAALLFRGVLHQVQGNELAAQSDFSATLALGDANTIRTLQQKMHDAGHYTGEVNGVVDAATEAAIPLCAADPRCN